MSARWPSLGEAAMCGLAGEIVGQVGEHSEADPVGLLFTTLTVFGHLVGPTPYVAVGGAHHGPRLAVVLIGESARARKGTSWADAIPPFCVADPEGMCRVLGGFGSGEALVDEVADAASRDKRMLVHESEFGGLLRVAHRDGSRLSPIIRDAWDGNTLQIRSRAHGAVVATGAHVTVLAHTTIDDLQRELDDVDAANGFANRFLYPCVRRARKLPSGGNLDDEVVADLASKVVVKLEAGRVVGKLVRTVPAEKIWSEWYCSLDDGVHGMVGALGARAEAQTLRLSIIYALLDGARKIGPSHVHAAIAAWDYCEESLRFLFDTVTGDRVADKLYEAACAALPAGLDGRQQSAVFSRHVTAKQLERARDVLVDLGLAELVADRANQGRPRKVLFACEQSE